MLYGGRHNYEELHREILSLKSSKAELERSRDEAISRSRDLELKYQDVLLELKQLNVSDNNRIAELECQLKVKSYELDRCSLLLGEVEAKYKHECDEKEKLKIKVEALREDLSREQGHSQKVICGLKLQLQDKSAKLDSYEKLEMELDKIIMRSAGMPDHDDAERVLFQYEKEAFIPLNSKRRLQQCLHLARRILELENHAAELKKDLFRERDLKKEVQDELTATKACLLHLNHPTSELIDLLLKRNLEIGKLKTKITVLENDIIKLKQTEHQLRKELDRLSEHGQELGAIKKMISDLQQPLASKLASTKAKKSHILQTQGSPNKNMDDSIVSKDKMQAKSKGYSMGNINIASSGDHFRIPGSKSNYMMISPTKKLIHIKKPLTFSKISQASLLTRKQ